MQSPIERVFEAVRSGDVQSLRELLTLDPKLAGVRNESGLSVVLQACYFRRPEMVELVLSAAPLLDIFEVAALPNQWERGAELLAADSGLAGSWSSDGFAPLHLASYFGNEAMARLLLEHGADPDAVSRNGMALRALHSACAACNFGIAAMLLERGADVNARQHGGWTALHSAASHGDLPLVELLVKNGADPGLASDDGKTSFDVAQDRGHTAILGSLRGQHVG
jgi:ankyrin repeat protein